MRYLCTSGLVILMGAMLVGGLGCASSPPTSEQDQSSAQTSPPPEQGPPALVVDRRDWSDEQQSLEERLYGLIEETPSFQAALDDNAQAFDQVLARRVDEQVEVERAFTSFTEAYYGDADIEGWASFRLGQMHLDMVCKIKTLEPPPEYSEPQKEQFRSSLAQQTAPLIDNLTALFEHSQTHGSAPWKDAVPSILAVVDDISGGGDVAAACDEAARYW